MSVNEDDIAKIIVDCAYKVHKNLGPGLLESTYEICLAHELVKAGLKVVVQKSLPVYYDGLVLDAGYRIDMLVEEKVIIELKCVDILHDIHLAQTLTYLKLSKLKLGLLINFNVKNIGLGTKRVVNGL
ncbi:MAG: GxxExxY protein [Bacteroidetes bacterium]|nr:GxxExxY protein [Bacteroidota bacterium]